MVPRLLVVVIAAVVAAVVVSWTGVFFDPLESAVAAVFLPPPEIVQPDGFMFGGMDLVSHSPALSGVLSALGFAFGLTCGGLLLGGVPLAIASIALDWRYECTRTWPFNSVTALQGAYSFQLSSLIAAASVAALLIACEWPIRPEDMALVVMMAMMVGITAVNTLGIRLWVRLIAADYRRSSDGSPPALSLRLRGPSGRSWQ